MASFTNRDVPPAFLNGSMGGCVEELTEDVCVYLFVTIGTILSNLASSLPSVQMLDA